MTKNLHTPSPKSRLSAFMFQVSNGRFIAFSYSFQAYYLGELLFAQTVCTFWKR